MKHISCQDTSEVFRRHVFLCLIKGCTCIMLHKDALQQVLTLNLQLNCLFFFSWKKKVLILSEQVPFLNHADRGHTRRAHYRVSTCAQAHWHLLVFLGFTSNGSASESSLPSLPSLIVVLYLHRRRTATQRMLARYLSSPLSKQIRAGFAASGYQTENAASSCCVIITEKHWSHFFQAH